MSDFRDLYGGVRQQVFGDALAHVVLHLTVGGALCRQDALDAAWMQAADRGKAVQRQILMSDVLRQHSAKIGKGRFAGAVEREFPS